MAAEKTVAINLCIGHNYNIYSPECQSWSTLKVNFPHKHFDIVS